MNAILNGTSLKIESQTGDQFTGTTFAQNVEAHPQYGRVLRCVHPDGSIHTTRNHTW